MKLILAFALALMMIVSSTLSWAEEPIRVETNKIIMDHTISQPQSKAVMIDENAVKQSALPECVDTGQPCTVGGTPCCDSTKSCTGKFPNTYCQ